MGRAQWGFVVAVDVLFLNLSSGYTDIFSFSKFIEWYAYQSMTGAPFYMYVILQ